ncbi:MAG: hypothetical protein O6940_07880 [Ignavibacteria bacterium]|nr:hypothetical protein [Ignavibacteria bacterium]
MLTLIVLFLNLPIPAQSKNTTPTNFPELKFEHLGVEHGLSQSIVNCVLQDQNGFMWFGTMDGLNRYDGYRFNIYKNDPSDSLSLANNFITALYEDHLGDLWVGTRDGGLCRYDRNQDSFIRYVYDKENLKVNANWIGSITQDYSGRVLTAPLIFPNAFRMSTVN